MFLRVADTRNLAIDCSHFAVTHSLCQMRIFNVCSKLHEHLVIIWAKWTNQLLQWCVYGIGEQLRVSSDIENIVDVDACKV